MRFSWVSSFLVHLTIVGVIYLVRYASEQAEINNAPTLVELFERPKSSQPKSNAPPKVVSRVAAPKPSQVDQGQSSDPNSDRSSDESASAGSGSGEKVLGDYEVAELPELIKEKRVPYPIEAKSKGVSGDVVAEIVIGSQGRVTSVKILNSPDPSLSEAARNAFNFFEFKPAKMDGKSVAVRIRYRYRFVIEN